MAGPPSSGAPLNELSAGEQAMQAFELLANETRLAILVALWESYTPYDGTTPVRFSELRDRVGSADSGQFNYHLDRLESHFVDATDDGYQLSQAGLKFVRSVIAGAGLEEPTLEPSEVDTSCSRCGGSVTIRYENGWVYVSCTECDGLWSDPEDPVGHLAKFSLDPAGLANRSPDEIYAAAWVRTFQRLYNMFEGVCPTCSGHVTRSLAGCEDHAADGMCSNCGNRARFVARLHCTVCKDWGQMTLGAVAKYHPAVVGFCHEHGLDLQYDFNDVANINRRLDLADSDIERLSDDPLRVRVTTAIGGEEISLDLDEGLTVLDVGR